MDPLQHLIACLRGGNKILICGNGGSSAQASHFAAELVVRYAENRRALPCIALNDPAILTACGNDFGFEQVFARQVDAYGQNGDVLIAISTSGKSKNVLRAIEEAWRRDIHVLALTGPDGLSPELITIRSLQPPQFYVTVLRSPGSSTAAIQEHQMKKLHTWALEIEKAYLP
jgi:phosphoheptose isomerase